MASMRISLIQKDSGEISLAVSLRTAQASIEHGILLLSLREIECQQLEEALSKRKRPDELRRI